MAKLTLQRLASYDTRNVDFNLVERTLQRFDYQPESFFHDGNIAAPDYIDYYHTSADGLQNRVTRMVGYDLVIDENGRLTSGTVQAIIDYFLFNGQYTEFARTENLNISAVELARPTATKETPDDFVVLARMLSGNDQFELADSNDYVDAFSGNDAIYGYGGSDTLLGGFGNDILDGGSGIDHLYGGRGNDTYVVDSTDDKIFEASSEQDTANDGIDLVRSSVNWTLGTLFENLTLIGTGTINATGNDLSNTLRGNDSANVLVGNRGDDRLFGNGGADSLDGGEGNDTLDGGIGDDTLTGGLGNDVYVVNSAGDLVTESGTSGFDTIRSSIDLTLGNNIEALTLLTGATRGTGNTLDNTIVGNSGNNIIEGLSGNDRITDDVGNDTIDGGGGNDTINSGAGNDSIIAGDGNDFVDGGVGSDVLDGGNGNDTYYVDDAGDTLRDASGTDTVYASVNFTLQSAFEHLILQGNAAQGTGNALANRISFGGNTLASLTLSGGGGNDAITGSSGSDVLLGGAGVDTLQGSAGSDSLDGGSDNDFLYGSVGTDTLTGGDGDDTLFGDSDEDTLSGGAGKDSLYGGSSADSMNGGLGDDLYQVDHEGDIVTEVTGIGSGIDLVQSTVNWTLGDNVENLSLISSNAVTGRGNALNNVIRGTFASETFEGLDGDDTLDSSSGNDSLIGGNGNDSLIGGAGSDSMVGGSGNDIYVVNEVGDVVIEGVAEGTDTVITDISYSLGQNVENLEANQTGSFSLLSLSGNSLNNTLRGSFRNESLFGGAGQDTLIGGARSDTLDGGDGADLYQFGRPSSGSVSDSTGNNSSASNFKDLGIDVVSVTDGDSFDFGVTEKLDANAGANAVGITMGRSGQQSNGSALIVAIRDAIDESTDDVFLVSMQDVGLSGTFSGMYLVQTSDTFLDFNDYIVKLVGTNVSNDDRLLIANGGVVYDVV